MSAMPNEQQTAAAPMSREEQLRIWLSNKHKNKPKARQQQRLMSKQGSHAGVGKGLAATRMAQHKENVDNRTAKFASRTPPLPDNRPFHERLFDKTTVASQLKARIPTKRRSLPNNIHTIAARKTPNNNLSSKIADRTPPAGPLQTNKRSKTEPRKPLLSQRPSSTIQMSQRRSFQTRRPSTTFLTPPPSSNFTSSNKRKPPNELIGRELIVDTKTPPPPMSPMASSVQEFWGMEESSNVELGCQEEANDNHDSICHDSANMQRSESIQEEAQQQDRAEQGPVFEPNNDDHPVRKEADFDTSKQESPTIADQILGGSVAGSTSSRDSFVNFKRRRRKRKKPLGNRTNLGEISSSEDDHVAMTEANGTMPNDKFQNHTANCRNDGILLDWRDNLSPDPQVSLPQHEHDLESCQGDSIKNTREQSSFSSCHETSIELDNEDETKAVKVVARRRKNRRRASVLLPLPDPTEEMSQESTDKEASLENAYADNRLGGLDEFSSDDDKDPKEFLTEENDEQIATSSINENEIISTSGPVLDFGITALMNQIPVKHDEKSILGTIRETSLGSRNKQTGHDPDLFQEMQRQIDNLLIEKKKLQKCVYAGMKDYEKRATPFRNLFDDMRALKKANEKLKAENRSINKTLQNTVASLQNQMTTALTTALAKRKEMEQKLATAEATIRELSGKLEKMDCGEI